MLQGMQRLDKKNDSRNQLQLICCRKVYQYYVWFVVRTMKSIRCLQHFYMPFLVFEELVKLLKLEMLLIIMLSKFLISNLKEII